VGQRNFDGAPKGVAVLVTDHWIESSQLGNQPIIPIKGNPANAGAKF
jgi:hypothetical protein